MIFILGGNGFVGSAFARYCRANGIRHEVIGRDNYVSHRGGECDILVNASGNSSKILGRREPAQDFDRTVRSVRDSLLDFRFGKYVLLSSCDVYADCSSPESTREDLPIDVSRQGNYGFHKYLAEECVRQYAPNWIIARLGGMVGPGLRKNAIFDIISGGTLWLDPRSELQYMRTDDVAKIVFKLIDKGNSNEVFNICGAGLVRLDRVAGAERVAVSPGSPLVRYDVNIEKIQKIVEVPSSAEVVDIFVREAGQVKAT